MIDALLAELDAAGATLSYDDGRPYLRVPADLPGKQRAVLLARVSGHRAAVVAHLEARAAAPPAEPEVWECVVCGRDVDAGTIPLLAGPALCSNGDGTVRGGNYDHDGNPIPRVPVCPFKTAKR